MEGLRVDDHDVTGLGLDADDSTLLELRLAHTDRSL
jgi:hypothetical protein